MFRVGRSYISEYQIYQDSQVRHNSNSKLISSAGSRWRTTTRGRGPTRSHSLVTDNDVYLTRGIRRNEHPSFSIKSYTDGSEAVVRTY